MSGARARALRWRDDTRLPLLRPSLPGARTRPLLLRRLPPARLPRTPPDHGRGAPSGSSAQTLYECPHCGERRLGERRCPDCNLFCRSLGPGALCPHCEEPLALSELLA